MEANTSLILKLRIRNEYLKVMKLTVILMMVCLLADLQFIIILKNSERNILQWAFGATYAAFQGMELVTRPGKFY